MTNRLTTTRVALLCFTLALLPFHAFLITWIKSGLGDGPVLFVLTAWKEISLVLICGLCAVELFMERRWPKFDWIDAMALALVGLSLVWLPFQEATQWLFGARIDLIPLIFFVAVRQVEWSFGARVERILFGGALVVCILGIVFATLVPQDFLTHFGYTQSFGEFDGSTAITSCQYLEHTQYFCRAISTFGGPTRYGAYLLVILGLVLTRLKERRSTLLLALILLNIVLTFSRSIWLGALVMTALFIWWEFPSQRKKIVGGGVLLAIAVAVLLYVLQGENLHNVFRSIFLRGGSTSKHFEYMYEGARLMLEHPFGMGLGTAGPASLRFTKLLTENWFLQIGVELGWLGMTLYAAFIALLVKRLAQVPFTPHKKALVLGIVGICTAGLLTHSFEELAAVVPLLFLSAVATRSAP